MRDSVKSLRIVFGAAFLFLPLLSLVFATDENLSQQLETLADRGLADSTPDQKFSGTILIARNGKPLVRKAYGYSDHKRKTLNTPETRFMIFSSSKQMTAAAILRLADQKRLNLNDPVKKHVKHWPQGWSGVKLHHLLSHTSGIDVDTLAFWLFRYYPKYWPETDELPPPYGPKALVSEPGTRFRYSNVGFTVLSLIGERVTGKNFLAFMQQQVFAPLAMTKTSLEGDPRLTNRARGHGRDSEEYMEQKTIDIAGAGDIVTNVDDLLLWDEALYKTNFLSSRALQSMFTPYSSSRMGKMGYGWLVEDLGEERKRYYHNGNGTGFRSYVFRRPDLHLYVAILANRDYPAQLQKMKDLEYQIEQVIERVLRPL